MADTGRPSKAEQVEILRLSRIQGLTTIPYMIIYFVVFVGLTHILVAVISGGDVNTLQPLGTPLMLLAYAGIMMFLLTLINGIDVNSLVLTISNGQVALALFILFVFIVWASAKAKEGTLLPELFSLAGSLNP